MVLDIDAVESVYVEYYYEIFLSYFCRNSKMENNIDDITLVFDLFFDELCFFLEKIIFLKELTLTSVSE